MLAPPSYHDSDRDSLHTLPLAIVPLATPGLSKARLVKNARLEGMVELFSGEQTGSGLILPCDLVRVFDFDESNRTDLDVVEMLAELPSYDVYSLRMELRRLNIDVNESHHLRLSDAKVETLSKHMRIFTRPLIAAIYGRIDVVDGDYRDIVGLFIEPEVPRAQRNLINLAKSMNIEVEDIPRFLEDYGDTYLSLAYYQSCLDETQPTIKDFMRSINQIQRDPNLRANLGFMSTLDMVRTRLMSAVSDIENVLEVFQAKTVNMWANIDGSHYRTTKGLIENYQTEIGKTLCAISVKMAAWKQKFPRKDSSGPFRRADFIMNDIKHGIETIQNLNYSDL